MGQVLQVDLDISPCADAPHGGDETNSRIGFDMLGAFCYTMTAGSVCNASATLASG